MKYRRVVVVVVVGVVGGQIDSCLSLTPPRFAVGRYQKLWKSYVKLRHLLANSPKVRQIDKQKLTQREVSPAVVFTPARIPVAPGGLRPFIGLFT